MTYLTKTITLETVKEMVQAGAVRTIYYGAMTCWWTHDPAHLCTAPGSGLPCDPRGGVLYQADDPALFLRLAEANADHYGLHGLDCFMAAHHLNCLVSKNDPRSTCMRSFVEYSALLDDPEGHES